MIRVQSIEVKDDKSGNYVGVNPEADVVLFADSKEDVTNDMVIEGMPNGLKPAFGSSVITAAGEIAFLRSDGSWVWVGDSNAE